MAAAHLCMVKLKGNRQCVPQPSFAVPSLCDEWVVEHTAVHADYSVQRGICNGRDADYPIVVGQVTVLTALDGLSRHRYCCS